MKNALLSAIFLFSMFSYASEEKTTYECSVRDKNVIVCFDKRWDMEDGYMFRNMYRMNRDGSWVKKMFVAENYYKDNENSWVRVWKAERATDWPCLAMENAEDNVVYRVVPGTCQEDFDEFAKMIRNGKKFVISGTGDKDPLYDIGDFEGVMGVFCESFTHVVTERLNKITHLRTDRKEYRNLKYSSYCEDFFASEALYWKP